MESHVGVVSGWFGVSEGWEEGWGEVGVGLPMGGEVVLVTGASGSGKSTLLGGMKGRAVAEGRRVVEMGGIVIPDGVAAIDAMGVGLEESLRLLAWVGLAEARVYVTGAGRLSEGQRWRLRLAVVLARAMEAGEGVIVFADEFAAVLDRVTAMIVAHSLRRVSREGRFGGVSFVLATSHSDLEEALAADRVVRCDFGVWEEEVTTEDTENTEEKRGFSHRWDTDGHR